MEGMAREIRHQAIREIVAQNPVDSQEQLVEQLNLRGFEVTQSSVSRDLQRMGAYKAHGRYVVPAGAAVALLREVVEDVKPAGPNLLVVRTATGAAQLAALRIDQQGWAEVVGTLAGDDTIFIATADGTAQAALLARLRGEARG